MKIYQLDASALDQARAQLIDLLLDVGTDAAEDVTADITADITADDPAPGATAAAGRDIGRVAAARYWDEVRAEVESGTRLLLAVGHQGRLVGSVQLDLCQQPDGHRFAELQQLMVDRSVRRRGLGGVLLRAAEAEANVLGRSLLFLDAQIGSGAEQLYHGYGYTCVDAGPGASDTCRPTKATYYKALLPMEAA
jgi:acetyltransferase